MKNVILDDVNRMSADTSLYVVPGTGLDAADVTMLNGVSRLRMTSTRTAKAAAKQDPKAQGNHVFATPANSGLGIRPREALPVC